MTAEHSLWLTYTPTPAPWTSAVVGLAAAGLAGWRQRGQPTQSPEPPCAGKG